ncbi:histidine kinase [Streptomyces phaeochromogenes]|uniref:sensor histidine kinase n=1 Tax=Streptomyces phaeochromogenes TaxID=1923 RepID=UPI0022585C5D|nr:histidine kinase [Streptomyces phaeochromogenes]MCX5597215.1 histidine kinase [Streptomyces phaeochromogenes]
MVYAENRIHDYDHHYDQHYAYDSDGRESGIGVELGATGLRLALFITCAVQLGYALMAILNLLKWHHESMSLVGAVLILIAFFGLQLFHCNPYAVHLRDRIGPWTLVPQAALAYAPFPMFGVLWGGFGGFLSGAVLVVLRGSVLAWVLFVLNAAAVCGLALASFALAPSVYLTLATVVIGLMVYGLTRLSDIVVEQYRLRHRTALAAVSGERLRVARDLHDLLGYSLSAITLKSELTLRKVGVDDDRARKELVETLNIARQALADVRAVARGCRNLSVTAELRSVSGVLDAADVETTIEGEPGDLDPGTGSVLAIVLREAVTNLLRHSAARHCRIEFGEADGQRWLAISNDGVEDGVSRTEAGRRGGGLGNLADRLGTVGGELNVTTEWGWFHLRAVLPARAAVPPPRPGRQPTHHHAH